MSASNSFESALLRHIFLNEAIANIGDATGLPSAATAGSLYIGLHTADPGEAGSQATSEATYTGYARVAVARTTGGWSEASGTVSNVALVTFPAATGGTNSITHFSIGSSASGAGQLRFSGALTAPLAVSNGITPEFGIGGLTISLD